MREWRESGQVGAGQATPLFSATLSQQNAQNDILRRDELKKKVERLQPDVEAFERRQVQETEVRQLQAE